MISIANPVLGERELKRVSAVIESNMLADGGKVRAFEREFADYCGVEHGVATSNGTTALHAALEVLEIGDGDSLDEIIVVTPHEEVDGRGSVDSEAVAASGHRLMIIGSGEVIHSADAGQARDERTDEAVRDEPGSGIERGGDTNV